ncbi:TNT domain-containing protein [Nocardioides sp. InS609-2]|uniref:TNT domain-containing protein n=1 Tax=Nocardioides sp. InS609-2 TaxID=2760705 RepID=UPI0020C08E99|nr:TNT domain-containing protein [Nocardioides sp. InS609-2]
MRRTRSRGGAPGTNGLEPGDLLDSIGSETGHHLYALGTSFPMRSQPPSDVGAPYLTLRVASNLPESVREGVAAPWFEQPGGGAMIVLDRPTRWYVDRGFLEPVDINSPGTFAGDSA